ncbi:polysaccharide pyruvyl transferase family protein [Gordonia rubripertincta]|uniref:polysaccharide pyruvyl transferase family protein n=1 Tax=Gordonia rubripertincta TaxID=36822 RepID=UPI001180303B|nr:polysaccharide pyruvyl transferase family protein [Gordonia rubripertincta]TSD96224.1 polysaccharide pyruvyl transferase family protein [Gordonia rubripertincta]
MKSPNGKTRVGIVTLTQSENYGTVLQAYATQKVLSQIAPDLEFELVPTDVGAVRRRRLLSIANPKNPSFGPSRAMNFVSMRRFIKPVLPQIDSRWINIEDRTAATAFLEDRYAGYITGSDEVWNLAHIGIDSIYYLPSDLPGPKASFATSANRLDISGLQPSDRDRLKKSLEGYSYITVRDGITRSLVDELIARPVTEIIDPTLQCESLGAPAGSARVGRTMSHRPRILMMVKNRGIGAQLSERFNGRADLYSCFIRQDNSRFIRLTPQEFASAPRDFDCVVTDFFHGTCMSIRSGAKFVSFDTEATYGRYESKIKNILGKLDCLDRYFDLTSAAPDSIDAMLNRVERLAFAPDPLGAEAIAANLEKEREHARSTTREMVETLRSRL